MGMYMDVHEGFVGATAKDFQKAHDADLAIEADEKVHFEKAWLDPTSGKAFCLSTGPSKEAVMRIHERAGHPTNEIYEVPIQI
ncbi:MAG: SCO4226 family nickel-binding protein [Hamadaea sp.]|nr:SCO4226 family nickel-binding protein [Hamadaea sp.]